MQILCVVSQKKASASGGTCPQTPSLLVCHCPPNNPVRLTPLVVCGLRCSELVEYFSELAVKCINCLVGWAMFLVTSPEIG